MIFDFRWFLPKTCFRHRKAPKFDAFFSWGYEKMNQKQNTKHPLSSRGMSRGCEIKCSTRKWWAKNNSDCSSPARNGMLLFVFFFWFPFSFLLGVSVPVIFFGYSYHHSSHTGYRHSSNTWTDKSIVNAMRRSIIRKMFTILLSIFACLFIIRLNI